ncbi:MAG: hypothetical protein WCJ09_13660 [Planctomycetota bacterium]
MAEPQDIIISCEHPDRIMGTIDNVMPELNDGVRRKLSIVKLVYWQRYGLTGLFERTNDRSVATILSNFDSMEMPSMIASGELNGIRYQLFNAPPVD